MRAARQLCEQGWALTTAAELGWPPARDVQDAFSGALVPDPRGPGKQHARDVVTYGGQQGLIETPSIAFTTDAGEVIDDFSRFDLLGTVFGARVIRSLLALVPGPHRLESGIVTADYYRYGPGAGSARHRDGFAGYVVIWGLGQDGTGGESFLLREGWPVLEHSLAAGEVVVFRDELFEHGVQPVTGSRDVLILITVKP